MITELAVENYRGFRNYRLRGLSRVNLLVGKNNSGKTSLLEAVHLLASNNPLEALMETMVRRSESLPGAEDDRERKFLLDPGFLFHKHDLKLGSKFLVKGDNDGTPGEFSCGICEMQEDPQLPYPEGRQATTQVALKIASPRATRELYVPLSRDGGVDYDRLARHRPFELRESSNFITSESLRAYTMSRLWDAIALTPAEERILGALRILEPRVERMTFIGYAPSPYFAARAGIVLKLTGSDFRFPLGSMGDGMRRILALSLAALQAANSVLIVDEIDTGLHYSVMPDMWKMLLNIAQESSVQVFATTHSQDCVNALGWVCEQVPDYSCELSLQRVEIGAKQSVAYSAKELAEAARRHLEVR